MIVTDFAIGLAFVVMGIFVLLTAALFRRQMKFDACLVRSRQRQLEAFDALKRGDIPKMDVLLAAAHEELERAGHYIIR